MSHFLRSVAEHYYASYGGGVSELRFVFPSRRAALFFRHYLSQLAERPIFAPECQTINDFITSLSPEGPRLADHTSLQFELYEAYREIHPDAESFDSFLYWGGVILKDFDLIDRHLVSARGLYANVYDYRELTDELEHLSPELRQLVEQFWGKFRDLPDRGEGESELMRHKFLDFWLRLYPLYEAYGRRLRQGGIAYEGALYREVAEQAVEVVDRLGREGRRIVFVGLFQLTPSEERLFAQIRRRDLGEWCWDRQLRILEDEEHPAYRQMQRNLELLGEVSALAPESDAPTLPRSIRLIRCSSSIAQVKTLPLLLDEIGVDSREVTSPSTAILLPDEQLLLPVVSSIPDSFTSINVSLGYPLSFAPVAVFIERWMRLLEHKRIVRERDTYPLDQLTGLLSSRLLRDSFPSIGRLAEGIKRGRSYYVCLEDHAETIDTLELRPLLELLVPSRPTEGIELLERMQRLLRLLLPTEIAESVEGEEGAEAEDGGEGLSPFDLEFIYHYLLLIERLRSQLERYVDLVDVDTAIRLLKGLIEGVNIPFEGNPLRGVQVMGLLEARGLHCQHVIYLSAEEGKLPRDLMASTLIPLSLRQGHGLPTGQEQDMASAYNFYQSIARAETLTLLYGAEEQLGGAAELSRYVQQLEHLYGANVEHQSLSSRADKPSQRAIIVEKEGEAWEHLEAYRLTHELSPSTLSIYSSCPLRFYYEQIEGLAEDETPSPLMQANEFGTILHNVVQELYRPYEGGREIRPQFLDDLLSPRHRAYLHTLVGREYKRTVLPKSQHRAPLSRLADIYCDLILSEVYTVLRYDRELAPFVYHAGELKVHLELELKDGRRVRLKGTIDRIDEHEGTIRVIDYKTGYAVRRLPSWQELFDSEGEHKAIAQTMIYCELLYRGHTGESGPSLEALRGKPLRPHIYHLPSMRREGKAYRSEVVLYEVEEGKTRRSERDLGEYEEFREAFVEIWEQSLEELFDRGQPFRQERSAQGCGHCPFVLSCGRVGL